MKRKLAFCVAALCLTMALAPSALAEEHRRLQLLTADYEACMGEEERP